MAFTEDGTKTSIKLEQRDTIGLSFQPNVWPMLNRKVSRAAQFPLSGNLEQI